MKKYFFGHKLREIREKKKLTMKKVAELISVSESMISQIETNKVSPAIDTLMNIAEVLNIDFEYLFSEFRKKRNVNLIKADQRNKITIDKVNYEQLAGSNLSNEKEGIEAYYLEIKPGCKKESTEYGHKGVELGIILKGSGTFKYGDQDYALGKGDSISYSADTPHSLVNTGKSTLTAYWVVTPPKNFFKEI